MYPLFYNRIEADYLENISIYELNKLDLLTNYASKRYAWKRGNNIDTVVDLRTHIKSSESNGDRYIDIMYQHNDRTYYYTVNLSTSHCNFGGFRYWFVCPNCYRSVGVLYLRGGYFLCRKCNHLTYASKKIYGYQKLVGRIISIPEVEAIKEAVKRKYYKGQMTRKYKRYLKIKQKAEIAFSISVQKFYQN